MDAKDVWALIEKVMSHPSIDSLSRGVWEDGEKGWIITWTKGGFTSGPTIEYTVKSALDELGLKD